MTPVKVSTAANGPNHTLGVSVVTQQLPRGFYSSRQRRFGNDSLRPDTVEQLIFEYDAVPTFNEVSQNIENQWLNPYRLTVLGQFHALDVELKLGNLIDLSCTIAASRRSCCHAAASRIRKEGSTLP